MSDMRWPVRQQAHRASPVLTNLDDVFAQALARVHASIDTRYVAACEDARRQREHNRRSMGQVHGHLRRLLLPKDDE